MSKRMQEIVVQWPQKTTPSSSLAQAVGLRCFAVAWLAAGGAAVAALSPWHAQLATWAQPLPWLLGLLSHWQWGYVVLGTLAAMGAVFAGRRSAWLALLLVHASWWCQLPAAPAATQAQAASPALTLGAVNLHYDNTQMQPLLDWLHSPSAPHVVVLHEFTPEHQQRLLREGGDALRQRYPYQSWHAQPDQFGMALFSRWPLHNTRWHVGEAPEMTPQLHTQLHWQSQVVALAAVHPMPPVSASYAQLRDQSVLAAAQHVAADGQLGIVAGDLNDTPWGAGMRALAPWVRRASGLAPTWPNAWGWGSILPLDHVLVTAQWRVQQRHWGPDVGSDHRPVVVSLVISDER